MKIIRLFLLFSIIIIAVSWFSNSTIWKKTKALHLPKKEKNYTVKSATKEKLEQKAAAVKRFVQQKGFNDSVCFLIDMSLGSGQNRFFIYDLKKDSLQAKGLVAHGNCFQYWLKGRKYSNVVGSGCTSLGKYKIGNSYTGNFGLSYKLMGLDKTNSRALDRAVVLHSYLGVPKEEVYPASICLSEGCPAVSPAFFTQLKAYMDESQEPILLWIYY